MTDTRFSVVFSGRLAPGMTRRQVRANLARMSQFTPEALDRFFSGSLAIRSGIDRKAAWRCWELFRRAGALCIVEPFKPVASRDRFATFAEAESTMVSCPCCHAPQDNTVTCTSCGVDMAICRLARQPQG